MTDGIRTPASDLAPGALVHGTRYDIVDANGTTTPVHSHRTVITAERQGPRMRVTLGPDSSGEGVESLDVAYLADHVLIVTPAPTIYASTSTHNTDPAPWVTSDGERLEAMPPLDWEAFAATGEYGSQHDATHAPDPAYDRPRAHEGNPILIAARESYDGSDPWGFALAWLYAVQRHEGYANLGEVREWCEAHELEAVVSLRDDDGAWSLPRATPAHIAHAERVFDRMADVARANGQSY